MPRKWKKEELSYLRRYARNRTLEQLATRFRTKPDTVSAKLSELGIAAKDSVTRIKLEHDPLVKVYERGVRALQRSRWEDALKQFQRVLDETDRPELAARAGQFLAVCRTHLEEIKSQKPADAFLQAVYERNRGNLDDALAICARGGRQGKDDRFAYLAAAVHALKGNGEAATRLLAQAIEMNPKNRVHAFHDRDFDELREDEDFANLLASA